MKSTIKKLKDLPEKNPKLMNRIYKAVTFAAAAISVALLLSMALNWPAAGSKPPADGPGSGASIYGQKENAGNKTGGNQAKSTGDRGIVEPLSPGAGYSPSPEPSGRTDLTLTVTDSEATGLMAISLRDRIPIDDISVSFASPDVITIGGKINKTNIGALIGDRDLPLLKAALILAPDTLDLSLSFSLVLDDGGHLSAAPVKATVNGINITGIIPQSAVDLANESLYSLLPDRVELHSLSISDGYVTFTIRA